MQRLFLLCCLMAAVAFLSASCRKKPEPLRAHKTPAPEDFPVAPLPPRFKKLPPDLQAAILEQRAEEPYDKAWAAADQAEFVRPAPAGFKPGPAARKIKLTLIPKKTFLRRGERFWYSLELQNVGHETIEFDEEDSIFKSIGHWPLEYNFWLTEPDGHMVKLLEDGVFASGPDAIKEEFRVPGWERMSEAEKEAAFKKWGRQDQFKRHLAYILKVTLKPGEKIVSRAWRHDEKASPDILGNFRELYVTYEFTKPGTYRLKLVYKNLPSKLSEDRIQRLIKRGVSRKFQIQEWAAMNKDCLGFAESNEISFEVSRW